MNKITNYRPSDVAIAHASTPLREDYLNYIFTYLAGAFGSAFTAKWEKTDPEAMKAVWGEMLNRYSDQPDAIKGALKEAVELQFPPSAGEFLAMCRKRYRSQDEVRAAKELDDKRTPEEKKVAAENAKKRVEQWLKWQSERVV
jgi:hypothetical protein